MSKMNNLHIVEAIYEGFAAGDMEAILDSMSEDIVWLHLVILNKFLLQVNLRVRQV